MADVLTNIFYSMKHSMHTTGEQANGPVNSPEQAGNFNESHNTSNNGNKYAPVENEISFLCRNIYHSDPALLKEHSFDISRQIGDANIKQDLAAKNYGIEGLVNGTDYRYLNIIPEVVEPNECTEEDIEIVISLDALSGELHFNILHIDDIETFIQSLGNRKVLAASNSTIYTADNTIYSNVDKRSKENDTKEDMTVEIHCDVDSRSDVSEVYKRKEKEEVYFPKSPESGDSISRIPGILHVPNINKGVRERRHTSLKETHEINRNQQRPSTTRYNTVKQRNSGSNSRWNSSAHHEPRRNTKIHRDNETKVFYHTRYYNTNTYCSDKDACISQPSKEQDTRKPTPGLRGKTNTSCSEGDLSRSRNQGNTIKPTPVGPVVKVLKRNEPLPSEIAIVEVHKSEIEHVQIGSDTFGKQDKVCTQSVAAPGSRAPPTKSEPEGPGDDESNTEKAKKKRKRGNKRGKRSGKLPKTQIEILQRMIEMKQLKSFFSKYKTEGLKNIKLQEEIHVGTYSTKYKATYQNEMVVLSVFTDQDISDIAAVDMAHMRSSYFVDCFKDCIRGPGPSLWLLTKLCRLGDLQRLLLRDEMRHVVGEMHAMFITAGVLTGIDYLHRHDIIHGNIKPSKIIFNNEGFPVLTGFLKVHEDPDVEKRDVFTPAYAAPERFRGDRTMAVDIFSIGCMAYEIITGRTPFDGGSLDDTKSRILNPTYRPWYDPDLISYAGEMFVDMCLRKQACERFTIGENRQNMYSQEWFSQLDFAELRRQVIHSPILDAIQLLNNKARPSWEEKMIDYDWGRVMDITCPNKPNLED